MKKKRWPIILVVIAVIAIIGVLGGSSDDSPSPTKEPHFAAVTTPEPSAEATPNPTPSPESTPDPTAKPTSTTTIVPTPKPTKTPEPNPTQPVEQDYVLNKNTKKFHYPTCDSVKQMKDKNKGYFTGTRDEVIAKGYSPCGNCRP